jgi:hypothetical protein
MALLTIKCPRTGDRISTGIDTDAETFARMPDAIAHAMCPRCGIEHTWRKSDAMLVEPHNMTKR